jgi:SAM-dependent methyltransferase
VEVVTAAFEEWPLPREPFDVVFSATAFHWIDPAVRVSKSADALRPGGLLATVGTHHIAGGTWTEAFFVEIQKCYERFDPSTPPGLRLEGARDIPEDDRELTSSGRFGPASFRRYEWELPYSTADYLDVLLTYSGMRALPDAQREGLLNCIAGLIGRDHGGRVVKRYMTELRLAHRVA